MTQAEFERKHAWKREWRRANPMTEEERAQRQLLFESANNPSLAYRVKRILEGIDERIHIDNPGSSPPCRADTLPPSRGMSQNAALILSISKAQRQDSRAIG